jgi:hypothetical protein
LKSLFKNADEAVESTLKTTAKNSANNTDASDIIAKRVCFVARTL